MAANAENEINAYKIQIATILAEDPSLLSNWKPFVAVLKLPGHSVHDLSKITESCQSLFLSILESWVSHCGNSANFTTLTSNLHNLGYRNCADKIYGIRSDLEHGLSQESDPFVINNRQCASAPAPPASTTSVIIYQDTGNKGLASICSPNAPQQQQSGWRSLMAAWGIRFRRFFMCVGVGIFIIIIIGIISSAVGK